MEDPTYIKVKPYEEYANNIYSKEEISFKIPKQSNWKCELFGTGPMGLTLHPNEDNVPNWFWRKMQYLCFGNKWIKVE